MPVVPTGHRIVGAETCRFRAPASMPDEASQARWLAGAFGGLSANVTNAAFGDGQHVTTELCVEALERARRLLETIPVLFVIITATFFMIRFVPGGPFSGKLKADDVLLEEVLEPDTSLDEAQKFVEFLVSEKGQKALASSYALEYPLNPAVSLRPPVKPLAELDPPTVDVTKLNGPKVIELMQEAGLL